MIHRTGLGHIEAAQIVSWGCTCGAAQVEDYGRGFTPEMAISVARARAALHVARAYRGDLTKEDM